MRLLSLVTLLPLLAAGQLVPDELVNKIDDIRKTWGIPGVGVSVVSGNETQLIALGNATATEPVTENSLFVLGSCTKAMTNYAVARLIANGAKDCNGAPLTWNTRIADILPKQDWKLQDKYAEQNIQLLDLSAMKSGLVSNDAAIEDVPSRETVRNMRNFKMKTFRAGYQYANLGYIVLQDVIETLSGKPFQDYMADMFNDWGLSGATFNFTQALEQGVVTGHYHTRDANKCTDSTWPNVNPACVGQVNELRQWITTDGFGNAAEGGAVMPLNQVQHFQRHVLQQPLDRPLIPTGGRDPFSSETIYGLGLQSYLYKGVRILGHSGAMPGHAAQIYHSPERQVSVAVMVNDSEWSSQLLAIMYSVFEQVLGLDKADWGRMVFDRTAQTQLPPRVNGHGPAVMGKFCNKGYPVLEFKTPDAGIVESLPTFVSNVSASQAQLPKSIMSHSVILTAVDPPYYNWTLALSRYQPPLVGPRSTTGTAVVTDKGIGMFGYFATADVDMAEPTVQDVERKSEVWFKRC